MRGLFCKSFLLMLLLISALVLFGCGNDTSDKSTPNDVEDEESVEPHYIYFQDIQFQNNIDDHVFAPVDSYKDLSFVEYSEDSEGEEFFTDEEKEKIWSSISYGEYCTDEIILQDILLQNVMGIAYTELQNDNISSIDDYIEFSKEMRENFSHAEKCLIDGVDACTIYYYRDENKDEDDEIPEMAVLYDGGVYVITILPVYTEQDELLESIKDGIKFVEESQDTDDVDDTDAISWKDAGDYVGETVTIKGKIAEVNYAPESNGSPVFIDLGEAYPASGRVTLTIWEEDQDEFDVSPENMESLYPVGSTIIVTGEIETYGDAYSIDLHSPNQISK